MSAIKRECGKQSNTTTTSHKNYMDIFTFTFLLNEKGLAIATIITIHALKIA